MEWSYHEDIIDASSSSSRVRHLRNVMVGLEEVIQVMETIGLWASGGRNVLSDKFSVDQEFLVHARLAPVEHIVHVGGRHTRQFSNSSCYKESHRDILREVAVFEVRHVFGALGGFHGNCGVGKTTVSLVGNQHGIDASLVADIIAIGTKHPFSDVV